MAEEWTEVPKDECPAFVEYDMIGFDMTLVVEGTAIREVVFSSGGTPAGKMKATDYCGIRVYRPATPEMRTAFEVEGAISGAACILRFANRHQAEAAVGRFDGSPDVQEVEVTVEVFKALEGQE
jgi:hypothetical protein